MTTETGLMGLTFQTVISRRLGDDRRVLVDDPEGVGHTLQAADGELIGGRVTGVDDLQGLFTKCNFSLTK